MKAHKNTRPFSLPQSGRVYDSGKQGDKADYLQMLARTRTQDKVRKALIRDGGAYLLAPREIGGGATMPVYPHGFLRTEMETGESFAARHFRNQGRMGSGVDGVYA